MKIAIITPGILPVPAVQGGAVENLVDFYLEYNNKHHLHDITIFSVYDKKVNRHQALNSTNNHYIFINTHSIWFKLRAKLYAQKPHQNYYYYQMEFFLELIIKKMKKKSFDLIVLENRPGFAIRLSEEFSTPIITHIHTNLLHIPSEENYKVMSVTKRFIVVSEYIKNEIKRIGIEKDIKVVYNGLDADVFNKEATVPISREKLGFKKSDFILVFWGRLVPGKGIKELLLAMQQLEDHEDIKLLIIGSINYEDKKKEINTFYSDLLNLAQNMQEKVRFTGYVPYNDIPRYLSSTNVAIIPSHINEAFGMTCIEACAMGLPVIATNDGGIPEVLTGQKHIIVDRLSDLPTELADAIIHIKTNYNKYKGNALPSKFTKVTYCSNFFKCINNKDIDIKTSK